MTQRPDPQQLDELVRRIVEAVHPLKIILFGSAARGEMGPESDVDLLVVMPEGTHRRRTAQDLRVLLFESGFPVAVDIVVAIPEDIEEYGHDIGYIYHTVLREGQELYAA
jgi:predicted nucleotidyltransferase